MPARRPDHHRWREVAAGQEGLVSRVQLLRLGLTSYLADSRLRSGGWVRVLPGVHLTRGQDGPQPELRRVWAALLYAGDGAVASHTTALWLAGAAVRLPFVVEIAVPQPRQVRSQPTVLVRRAGDLGMTAHPILQPPRNRIEAAVVDAAGTADTEETVVDVVLRAIQRRLTTPERLLAELARRPRHRWRRFLIDLLAEAGSGVSTPLERRYVRDVEQAHGLPRSIRNRPDRDPGTGASVYRDMHYAEWLTVVETDGREAHPDDEAYLDRRRDNALLAGRGEATLRYGWRDVTGRPCLVALEVSTLLRARGWPGRARPCGPTCDIGRQTS
jgi:hypothetical protein